EAFAFLDLEIEVRQCHELAIALRQIDGLYDGGHALLPLRVPLNRHEEPIHRQAFRWCESPTVDAERDRRRMVGKADQHARRSVELMQAVKPATVRAEKQC